MKIGILALQGAFSEHDIMLRKLNIIPTLVTDPRHLKGLNGIILPGGESTTIGMLLKSSGLYDPLKALIESSQIVVWGTCAGFILLCENVVDRDQILLGGLPLTVERNAFGRQINSFVETLQLQLKETIEFPGVFIRAPRIVLSDHDLNSDLRIFAKLSKERNSDVVGVLKDDRIMGTSFHPELTNDSRMHQIFLQLCSKNSKD